MTRGLSRRWCATLLLLATSISACASPRIGDAEPVYSPPPSPNVATPMASLPIPGTPIPTATPRPAWITGIVFDFDTSTGIAGAQVTLEPFGVSVRTDSRGHFVIEGLRIAPPCRWVTVTVAAADYGRMRLIDTPVGPVGEARRIWPQTSRCREGRRTTALMDGRSALLLQCLTAESRSKAGQMDLGQ